MQSCVPGPYSIPPYVQFGIIPLFLVLLFFYAAICNLYLKQEATMHARKENMSDTSHPDSGDVIEIEVIAGNATKMVRPGAAAKKDRTSKAAPHKSGRETSTAKWCDDGTVIFPTIRIQNSEIYVATQTEGGGWGPATRLNGSGGTFVFPQPGPQTIPPGEYRHLVDGHVTGHGCIISIVTYH